MNKIGTWIVKKPGVFIIIFLALTMAGILSYFELDKQEDPNLEVHEGIITTTYPGASSEVVEQKVTEKIESAIQNIPEIHEVISYSYPDVSIIHLILHDDIDLESSWDKVRERLDQVSLVEYASEPELKVDVAKTAFTIVQLASNNDEIDWQLVTNKSKELEKQLIQVNGIESTEILGLPDRQLSISLDLDQLATYGLSWRDINQFLEAYNFHIPEGNIKDNGTVAIVQTERTLESIEGIENIPIVSTKETGETVYLKDLASVHIETVPSDQLIRYDGNQSVSIVAYGEYHTDARVLGKEIREVTEKWQETLPDNYEGQIAFDQSKNVNAKFSELLSALLLGMIVVIFVCFLTLSFRAAIVTGMMIPISIVISLFFMDITGIALHQISLAALIVVIGILVDDSIVSNENIERHILIHKSNEGIAKSIQEIAPNVAISTLCLIIGFAPLLFLGGDTGQFIIALPQIMIISLLVSTLSALLLVPSVRTILDRKRDFTKPPWNEKIWKKISQLYKSMFDRVLNYYRLLSIGVLLISSLFASLFLLLDVQFFPKAEEREELMIDIELPIGSEREDTIEHLNLVESVLDETEGVNSYISSLGDGLPRVYYNENPLFPSDAVAQILVHVDPSEKSKEELLEILQDTFRDSFGGIRINVRQFEQGPPTGEPIQIRLTGSNLDELAIIAKDITSKLDGMDGVIQEYNTAGIPQKVINVHVDQDSALSFGVFPIDVALTNRLALEGIHIGEFQGEGNDDELPIILKTSYEDSIGIEDFNTLLVPSRSPNGPVSLEDVTTIENQNSPPLINRYNGDRVIFISAYVENEANLTQLTKDFQEELSKMESNWEEGYNWSLTGIDEQRGEAFDSMYKFFLLSVSMIFVLLYILFHSLWRPFIVMVGVFMSVGGAMVGLFLMDQPLGFMSLLGIIGLSGIVVRNGMMLVEFTDIYIQKGMNLKEALSRAGSERIRPIMITTLTTVGGMLPMAFIGGSLWAPLAITIISGLIYSTILTLFVVPSLYYWFGKRAKNLKQIQDIA